MELDRRSLLRGGALLLAVAALPVSVQATAGALGGAPAGPLSLAAWTPLVGRTLAVAGHPGQQMLLVRVTDTLPTLVKGGVAGSGESFRLDFRPQAGMPPDPTTLGLHHPDLGVIALDLTPTGRHDERQAVICTWQPRSRARLVSGRAS